MGLERPVMQYLILLDGSEPGTGYDVMVPDLPGCFSAGDTLAGALTNAKEAIECHLEGILMDGERIPQPSPDIEVGTGQLVGIVSVDLAALQRAVA